MTANVLILAWFVAAIGCSDNSTERQIRSTIRRIDEAGHRCNSSALEPIITRDSKRLLRELTRLRNAPEPTTGLRPIDIVPLVNKRCELRFGLSETRIDSMSSESDGTWTVYVRDGSGHGGQYVFRKEDGAWRLDLIALLRR